MTPPFTAGDLVRPLGCDETGEVIDCYPAGFDNWLVNVRIAGGIVHCKAQNLVKVNGAVARLPTRLRVVGGTDAETSLQRDTEK